MKITIVYDNEIYTKGIGLQADWGFASIIETEQETLLFDSGAKGDILLNNMKKLRINPQDIQTIIISHDHTDHKGGLPALVPYITNIKLYQLSHKVPSDKITSITPEIPEEITKNIWTTGRVKNLVDEQSLVIITEKNGIVLTGCSHPGIDKILQIAQQIATITVIIGGFHGFNKFNIIEDLKLISPCHCTAHKLDLKNAFPEKTLTCGVGKTYEFK